MIATGYRSHRRGEHGAVPSCLDYPHIGADANGFYITTNSYPWGPGSFDGAQIYAFSKAQRWLAGQRGFTVTQQRHDRHGERDVTGLADRARLHGLAGAVARHRVVQSRQRRHRVLPELERRRRGVRDRVQRNFSSDLEPSRGLDADEHLVAEHDARAQPLEQGADREPVRDPAEVEPAGIRHDRRQDHDTSGPPGRLHRSDGLFNHSRAGCWRLLFSGASLKGAQREVILEAGFPNGHLIQQVGDYANGKLWGALDTAVSFDNIPANNRAGIAWWVSILNSG